MAHVVTGPAAVVDVAGKQLYFYAGALLPEGIAELELERLAGLGLITEAEETPIKGATARKGS